MIARVATTVPCAVRVDMAPLSRYAQLDRACYHHAPIAPPPALVSLAEQVAQRALATLDARVIELRPGDYLLAHHDEPFDGVELVLDLSPTVTAGAEVRWRRPNGAVFYVFPSSPGHAAVVEREPGTGCYHTYVSKLHAADTVVRRVLLRLTSRA